MATAERSLGVKTLIEHLLVLCLLVKSGVFNCSYDSARDNGFTSRRNFGCLHSGHGPIKQGALSASVRLEAALPRAGGFRNFMRGSATVAPPWRQELVDLTFAPHGDVYAGG